MDTSYLEKQVSTIINKLHELFDEIGVPSHERDSRESELFAALSETLHNQLRLVTNEKHELTEEANRLVTTIKQMQQSLDGAPQSAYSVDDSLQVAYPLKPCLQSLKEQHKQIAKLHHERYTQVKQLAQAIESYSSHLEPSFTRVQLPPTADNATCPPTFDLSHAYFSKLDDEFTRVYNEYEKRLQTVKNLSAEIITLWAELGTPQAQTDSNIVSLSQEAPEQLGLHKEDITRLQAKRDKLVEEKKGREKRLKDLRAQIEALWERLGITGADQKQFLAANRGCGMRAVNEFEDELARLNELKRQNLGLFVEEARIRLQELWDGLYFSEEEMLDFTPAFSDVYSDALLAAHEAEIARLEVLTEQRAPTLAMIDKYRSLVKDRDDLAASSQDASRLMAKKGEKRDPTRLLREEKMRKRITKELPKVEAELRKELEKWEDEYGRPFLVHGERYLDELEMTTQAKALPPRSKTPSVPPSAATLKKPAPTSVASKASSVRGGPPPPPPRSKTPSAMGHHTLPRNVVPPSTSAVTHSTATVKSPSRIPARVPLSTLQHGNNSPPKLADGTSTLRGKVMGPPRLPPPKMKDLFSQSTIGERTTPRPNMALGENMPSSSIVRHVAPEDVYDDREDRTLTASQFHNHQTLTSSFSQSAYYPNTHAQQHNHHQSTSSLSNDSFPSRPPSSTNSITLGASTTATNYPRPNPYGIAPPTRQTSNTSTASSSLSSVPGSQISGSENWETYSSASSAGEPEPDLRDTAAYYARLRAQQQGSLAAPQQQQQGKRAAPDGGWNSPGRLAAPTGKRVKGLMGPSLQSRYVSAEGGQVEGSEAGWTDEDGF